MTKILEQLKQAEAQREHVVAERKQLEAEANAALAAHERDELARRAVAAAPGSGPGAQVTADRGAAQAPRQQDWRMLAGVAVIVAVALVAVFWGILFAPQEDAATHRGTATAPKTAAQIEARGEPLQLRIDQDLGAFAARVREKEKR